MPIGNPTSTTIDFLPTPEAGVQPQRAMFISLRKPLLRAAIYGSAIAAPVALPAATFAAQPSAETPAETLSPAEKQDLILESAAVFNTAPKPLAALGRAACRRQKELDPRSFTTCEYTGAYAAVSDKFSKWVDKNSIPKPGTEDKTDRKRLYWKAYPGQYQLMRQETEAGMYYVSPRPNMWEKVNEDECDDTWNCNTGNGYYGGLQMSRQFQKTYNPHAFILWGTADKWPKPAQLKAADLAYVSTGLNQWPHSNELLGSYPCPVSSKASIKARC